jgi:hypothetical protein
MPPARSSSRVSAWTRQIAKKTGTRFPPKML